MLLPTKCPYGQPGDRLWVREAFLVGRGGLPCYRADGVAPNVDDKWKPSIHMPRAYSRITLEVTGVRVERVLEISPQDAWAEGIDLPAYAPVSQSLPSPVDVFSALWDSINGKKPGRSWADNPYVWVVEFKHMEEHKVSGQLPKMIMGPGWE